MQFKVGYGIETSLKSGNFKKQHIRQKQVHYYLWGFDCLEREELFKFVQKHMKNVPLMLIGSGGSAPCGLPGMSELGAFLISRITPKYSGVSSWDDFCSNLEEGQDLETALSSIALSPELLDDIKIETWNLVSKRDLALFSQIALGNIQLSLTSLLKKLYQTHPQCLNIITTNYDRVIEYACDLARLKVNTGFEGCYLKRYAGAFATKTVVNLIKVHGSLDVFRDAHDSAFSVVMQQEIPIGLVPEIITPGLSKFQAILRGTSRQLLTESDRLINQAQSFLAIGYGFNDEQVQENIIASLRSGKPIVVITKTVSERAAHLLANNATNYVYIQQGEAANTTEFCVNKKLTTIEGNFWTVDGFMKIID